MNGRHMFAAGLLVFLAGCTMIPKYERPEAAVPAAWPDGRPGEPESGSLTNVASIPWQDFYVDPGLRQVIELALTNNRDLRAAVLRIEKTRELYRIQRADLLPTVKSSGFGTSQQLFANVDTFEKSVRVEYYTVNLGFSAYELDIFGRIRSLKARALEEYLATEQAARALQVSLLAEVAAAYLNLAAGRERLRIARATLENREAGLGLIRRRHEAGEAPELDVQRALGMAEAARADVAGLDGQLAIARNALALLAGAEVPNELLPETLESVTAGIEIHAGLPSEVLQRRPDIMEAENLLRAANANIGAARAAFFPSVTLTGNYGTMDDQLSGLFQPGSWIWAFTPQITLPIFDSGRNSARLGGAKIDRDIALAQYEKAIQSAFREVADSLVQRNSILGQLKAQEMYVTAAESALRIAEGQYRHGDESYLAVLDSQRELYSAQQGLVAMRLAGLANLVTLYKALGGG